MTSRNQLGYLFHEAIRGFRSDTFLTVTSVITIGICASALACLLTAVTLVRSLEAGNASETAIRVFVDARAEDATSLNALRARLFALPGVDSAVFVSKERALDEFKRDFGDEMIRSLDWNPLPPSFLVYPSSRYQSASQNRMLQERIRLMKDVEEIGGNSLYLAWLDKWKLPVQWGSLLLMAFAAGAMAVIIHNAIHVGLHSRRELVENMKYCGAGQAFILTPFLLEGIALGLGGGLIGIGVLASLLGLSRFLSASISENAHFWPCAAAILFVTVAVAAGSSARTVRRFLREPSA